MLHSYNIMTYLAGTTRNGSIDSPSIVCLIDLFRSTITDGTGLAIGIGFTGNIVFCLIVPSTSRNVTIFPFGLVVGSVTPTTP